MKTLFDATSTISTAPKIPVTLSKRIINEAIEMIKKNALPKFVYSPHIGDDDCFKVDPKKMMFGFYIGITDEFYIIGKTLRDHLVSEGVHIENYIPGEKDNVKS